MMNVEPQHKNQNSYKKCSKLQQYNKQKIKNLKEAFR